MSNQFNRKDENGNKTLFPKDFVWAEVEYAMDVDYQKDAEAEGINANGKYQHSLAGLKKLPTDGYYKYRTNPNPETDPWIITGAMKVNKVLSQNEVDELVRKAGREPQKVEGVRYSLTNSKGVFVDFNEDGSYKISDEVENKGLEANKLIERVREVQHLSPIKVIPKKLTTEEGRAIYESLGNVINEDDGRNIELVKNTYGKIITHKGYDILSIMSDMNTLVKSSLCLWGEREVIKKGHKIHNNFEGYHHYVNKFNDGNDDYYIAFTVQELKVGSKPKAKDFTPYQFHNAQVSDIDIVKATESSITTPGYGPGNRTSQLPTDTKLQNIFSLAKEIAKNSAINTESKQGERFCFVCLKMNIW